MSTISDATQAVVDEISSGRAARSAALGHLSAETRRLRDEARRFMHEVRAEVSGLRGDTTVLLEQYGRERARDTRALRENLTFERGKLSSHEAARRGAARRFLEDLAVEVSELRSDAHTLLERYGLERGDGARALRETLSSTGEARRHASRRFLDEIASDLERARRIWTEATRFAPRPVGEKVAAPPKVEEEELGIEEQVLAVIRGHPGGIRLVDIGNELGVDWRSLIGVTKALVDAGKIEKIDTSYYAMD